MRPDRRATPELTRTALTRADVGAVYRLYLSALAAVPDPAAVRADEPEFFEAVFDDGGEILGLADDSGLVAYGVLRPELEREHDRVGLDRFVAPDAPLRVLDGSAVRPAYWRLGLQREVVSMRLARARTLGASDVIAKASPGNIPSMRNLLKSGFAIVGLVRKPYGWRYVHHRAVSRAAEAEGRTTWVRSADIDAARTHFATGEAAFACEVRADGVPWLQFAPLARAGAG